MKLIITAAALSLFVSVSSLALPRQDNEKDKRDNPPPQERQDEKKQQDDKRQQDDRKRQDDKKQQDEKAKDRDRSQDRDRAQQQDRERQDRDRAQQPDRDRSSREDRDQRSGEPQRQDPNRVQQDRDRQSARNSGGHGRGQRIAEDRFRSSFGREHTFHVQRQSGGGGEGGGQRFQYGGYHFEYVEAWPSDWSYGDDFYIESIGDDYYLYDLRHPEVRILVIVVE